MTDHAALGIPACISACAERVLRISVLPSRTIMPTGTSFGVKALEPRSPATSLIDRPASEPPLRVQLNVRCAKLAPSTFSTASGAKQTWTSCRIGS
jgi:hypothetical protein